jgi:hypothetical protein
MDKAPADKQSSGFPPIEKARIELFKINPFFGSRMAGPNVIAAPDRARFSENVLA